SAAAIAADSPAPPVPTTRTSTSSSQFRSIASPSLVIEAEARLRLWSTLLLRAADSQTPKVPSGTSAHERGHLPRDDLGRPARPGPREDVVPPRAATEPDPVRPRAHRADDLARGLLRRGERRRVHRRRVAPRDRRPRVPRDVGRDGPREHD